MAPTIPINSFSYINFLRRVNQLSTYEQKFGRSFYGGVNSENEKKLWDIEEQMFLWGCIDDFDTLAKKFLNDKFSYSICPVRYSIGAILYERDWWSEMGQFCIGKNRKVCVDGTDEDWIISQCMIKSRAIVVSDNVLAGHFAFGVAYKDILKIFKEKIGEV